MAADPPAAAGPRLTAANDVMRLSALCDDLGLGKTLMVLAAIAAMPVNDASSVCGRVRARTKKLNQLPTKTALNFEFSKAET